MTEKKQEQELDPMDRKDASISITLKNKGYTSKDTGMVSPRQWGLINQIVHNKDTDEYSMLAKRIGLTEIPNFPGRYNDEKGGLFVTTKYGFKRIIKRS